MWGQVRRGGGLAQFAYRAMKDSPDLEVALHQLIESVVA
jgi:hypothetical protein